MIQKLEYNVIDKNGIGYEPSIEDIITKLNEVIDYINSLPDENNPEPYNPVYDEDYLNEKIAKATKSWEGVDVDAMLADCRGYEEKPSEELEEAAEHCVWNSIDSNDPTLVPKFIPLLLSLFISGAYWQKEQMMKDAVEGFVATHLTSEGTKVTVNSGYLPKEMCIKSGNKVRIIIVKED